MRTLSEILADELQAAYPLDTLDSEFDAVEFDLLVQHVVALEEGE